VTDLRSKSWFRIILLFILIIQQKLRYFYDLYTLEV
jgi:hypothetical protein